MATRKETILKFASAHKWALALVAGILLIAGFFFFYHLGREAFQDYDESTYAEIAKEDLASHNYFTYTYGHQPYFNKPPVLFWALDISDSLLHGPEFSNRFPSALSGLLLVGVVIICAYAATGSLSISAVAGAILATTSAFIESARQVRFDIMVSLFITLSTFAFLRALEQKKETRVWFLWMGLFLGLTVLTKGPLVLFAFGAMLGGGIAYWSWWWLRDTYFWYGVGIFFVVAASWHIYETILFGMRFWDTYLFGQLVDRVNTVLFIRQPTNELYIQYIFEFAAPWAQITIGSLAIMPFLWNRLSKRARAAYLASIFGIVSVVGIDFETKTKAFSYLIPLYPFMAIACTVTFYEVFRWSKKLFAPIYIVAIVACIGFGFQLSVVNGFHLSGYYTAEVALADEERVVAAILVQNHAQTFDYYDVTALGAIKFYSQILEPSEISSTTTISQRTYLLYPTTDQAIIPSLFPSDATPVVYVGKYISLALLSQH